MNRRQCFPFQPEMSCLFGWNPLEIVIVLRHGCHQHTAWHSMTQRLRTDRTERCQETCILRFIILGRNSIAPLWIPFMRWDWTIGSIENRWKWNGSIKNQGMAPTWTILYHYSKLTGLLVLHITAPAPLWLSCPCARSMPQPTLSRCRKICKNLWKWIWHFKVCSHAVATSHTKG
jgi:hypothetical protein